MYGILGEDASDVETLKVFVRRLETKHGLPITRTVGKGYTGTGELLKKGARDLSALAHNGCTKFVVVRDADQKNPGALHAEITEKIIRPAGITGCVCILIAVQEIEAWLLADITKASRIFSGWKDVKEERSPESISKPKEYLEKLSRQANGKPRYRHAVYNSKLAEQVDLDLVSKRCGSFRPLENLVVSGKGNL